MNLLIRADSSSAIGLGHIMRDLVLASQYPHAAITFACLDLPGNIIDQIPYPVHILKSDSHEELIALIQELAITRLIIDHYGIDAAYEKRLKDAAAITLIAIDDTYVPHYCDILINPNIYADPSRYTALVPNHTILRCGKEYMLLREPFYEAKAAHLPKTDTILIAMGGSDPHNLTSDILALIEDSIPCAVVTTHANPHLESLRSLIEERTNTILYVNTPDMARIMATSALAIITPSSIAHEAIFLQTPFIAIKSAENQNEFIAYMQKEEMNVMEYFDPIEFKSLFDSHYDRA